MKSIRTSAKLVGAMKMKCAVVSTLVSLAFVSQAFAVLRPPFPAKTATPFDGELIIIGDDLVPGQPGIGSEVEATASPTFLLVTIPPLQMSKSVATQVSHAKRLSH